MHETLGAFYVGRALGRRKPMAQRGTGHVAAQLSRSGSQVPAVSSPERTGSRKAATRAEPSLKARWSRHFATSRASLG